MTPNPATAIDALLPKSLGNAAAMQRVAEMMLDAGRRDEAIALAEQALAIAEEPTARQLRDLLARLVPGWHFLLVRDAPRNAAYRAAIDRALTLRPGARVLEIGTGTGLLALYAAQAGASEVVTCEVNPLAARAATQVVADNGLADRIRVLSRHSGDLEAQRDIGWRADILLSEIIANDVLSEGVLPAHEHAVRKLVAPGAIIIPGAGAARVALVEDGADSRAPLTQIDGFDLSAFNRFIRRSHRVMVDDDRLVLRSDPADLFRFDFASARYLQPEMTTLTLAAKGGRVTGVLQWVSLDLGGGIGYENAPGGHWSNWAAIHHRFDAPVETAPGEAITISAAHNRRRITVWRG